MRIGNSGKGYWIICCQINGRQRDIAEQTRYPGEIAEAALAHSIVNKVEAAYRRTDYLENRCDMMRDWERFCIAG